MTAHEVRQTNNNLRLAWYICEDKVPADEMQNFTKSELETLLPIITDQCQKTAALTALSTAHN